MKPPCVVDFYLLSTEWSKNLFTIIIMDCKTADEKLPRNYALTLNVYQKNTRALSFYQREGFDIQCEGADAATGEKEYTMLWQQK